MLLTVTPSAEEAVKAYEPTFLFLEFAEMVCPPKALFAATVRLDETKLNALPFEEALEAIWLEVKPCKLFVLPVKTPVTVLKVVCPVDVAAWTSASNDSTRVVFAGMM